jgi:gluconate 2-dehydrogenase alpha chain
MATRLPETDVVIIGLGAAGGVAVLPLARAGLRVIGLEAGTWMNPARDYRADEIHNNVRSLVTTGNKAGSEIPTFRNNPNDEARQAARHPMMNAVGGTSIHYHAQSWRLNPWDFRIRTSTIDRYGAGYLPAGSTVEDWPLSYADLEPYYDNIEWEVGVSGKAGNIQGRIDPLGNVFEGPRQREYPMPPLRGCDFTDHMTAAARSIGFHPYRGPAAINSQPYEGRPGCAFHGYCDRGGCHIRAKSSTDVTTIPKALATGNLTVTDNANVRRIETDNTGRVTGVTYIRDGEEFFQPARAVLSGCYTYENIRLLFLSRSAAHPDGIGNSRGQLGRHYFSHWDAQAGTGVSALFPFDLNIWYGAIAQGVMVDDWADDNFDHSGLGFIGGASLHSYTEKHPIAAAGMSTFDRTSRRWGSVWKKFISENAGRWTSAYVQTTTLPYENTWADLDPNVKDPFGDPVLRVTSGPKSNEPRAALHAAEKMVEWFRAAGAIEISPARGGNGPALSTHAHGGTRMGLNPDTSVTDAFGFVHDAPNLGMLGGSVMGTAGARNPTQTLQALAWRTAEHLARNWNSIAGTL